MFDNIFINLSVLTDNLKFYIFAKLFGCIINYSVHLLECIFKRHHTHCHYGILKFWCYFWKLACWLLEVCKVKSRHFKVRILQNYCFCDNKLSDKIHQKIHLFNIHTDKTLCFTFLDRSTLWLFLWLCFLLCLIRFVFLCLFVSFFFFFPRTARLLAVYKYRRFLYRSCENISCTRCRFTLSLHTEIKKFITGTLFYLYVFYSCTWIYKFSYSLWSLCSLKCNPKTKFKNNICTVRIWDNVRWRIKYILRNPFKRIDSHICSYVRHLSLFIICNIYIVELAVIRCYRCNIKMWFFTFFCFFLFFSYNLFCVFIWFVLNFL